MRTWLWLWISACGGGVDSGAGADDGTADSGAEPVDPATVPLAGPCAMDVDYGGFEVSGASDGAGVSGSVGDGVVPTAVLEEIGAEGDCVLLRRNNPFCDPACDAGETCDFDGECVPYPANQDLGTVHISGLVAEVELEPVFPGNTYYDTSLPAPPYVAGELVTLDMPAGVYGPATVYGVGVESLDGLDTLWTVESGVDLQVGWGAPAATDPRSHVLVTINVDQHGVSPGTLFCTFEDVGAGTVPGSLIATLVDSGVTGFPSGSLARRTVDHAAAGAGCFDLTISETAGVEVDVVGFTPCVGDSDCPEGQTCNEELQVCE